MSKRAAVVLSLAAALAACGGDDGTGNEGDGDGDGDGDAGGGSAVVLTVRAGAVPASGVDVVFHDSSGAVLSTALTNGSGQVTAELPADSMLTVIPAAGELRTITGVQPGDDIAMDIGSGEERIFGSVRATLDGAVAGAASYTVHLGCAAESQAMPSPAINVPIPASCRNAEGAVDVYAVARDGTGVYLATAFLPDVAVTQQGAIVDVSMPSWDLNPDSFTLSLSNIPADANQGSPTASGGAVLDGRPRRFGQPLSGGAAEFGHEADISEALAYRIALLQTTDVGGGSIVTNRVQSAHVAVAPARAVDLASELIPQIDQVVLDAADPMRPSATYASSGALEADSVQVQLDYGEDAEAVEWEILGPPGDTVRAPELPAELAGRWAPPAPADIGVLVLAFRSTEIAGYDRVRAAGELTGGVRLGPAGSSFELSVAAPIAASAARRLEAQRRIEGALRQLDAR